MSERARIAIVALIAALLGVGLAGVIGIGDETKTNTATMTTAKTVVDSSAPATPAQVAEAPPAGELQSGPEDIQDLRDSTPDGVSQKDLDKAEQEADAYAEDHGVEDADAPIALGGAQGYSCRKSYQSRGYGSFRSYFSEFVLHYTVSANARGWSDVYNIKSYLNSVGLSATFVMDFEGHCLQTVPLDRNPYTQGGMNQYSTSVEIIATGKETRGDWLAAPIFRQGILAALVRDVLKSHNLPVRFVDPVGCTPKAGYTDHNHLECGNSHVDVSPNFPFDVFARQVQASPQPVCAPHCKSRLRHARVHRRLRETPCRSKAHRRSIKKCNALVVTNKRLHRYAAKHHYVLKVS